LAVLGKSKLALTSGSEYMSPCQHCILSAEYQIDDRSSLCLFWARLCQQGYLVMTLT